MAEPGAGRAGPYTMSLIVIIVLGWLTTSVLVASLLARTFLRLGR